jgi:hypothetical protein
MKSEHPLLSRDCPMVRRVSGASGPGHNAWTASAFPQEPLVPPPLFVRPIGPKNQDTGSRSQARGQNLSDEAPLTVRS